MSGWTVYIIETQKGSLYTGITTDVKRRFQEHSTGKGARFFRTSKPKRVVYQETGLNRGDALSREAAVKRLSAEEKRRLAGCRRKRVR